METHQVASFARMTKLESGWMSVRIHSAGVSRVQDIGIAYIRSIGDKKAAEKTSQALREKAIDDDAAKGGKPTATVLMPTLNTYLPITGMNPLTTANVMGNMLAGTTAVGEGGAAGKEEDGKPKAKDNKKDTTEDVIQTEGV